MEIIISFCPLYTFSTPGIMAPSPTPYVAWGVQVEPEQPTPIPPETAAPQQTEAQQLITASGSLGVLTVGRKEIPIAGNVDG